MGTCIQQDDLFYSVGLYRNHVLATASAEEIGRGFRKNAGEWTRRVEISKEEEIPGSKHRPTFVTSVCINSVLATE